VHLQAQPIDRVVELGPSVFLLIILFGYITVLTGMTDLPHRQIPLFGVETPTLAEPSTRSPAVTHLADTRPAPGRDSPAVAHHYHLRRLDRFRARQATTIAPVGLDRSFDLRADLMDMARSLRWHRGAPSGLPPGSE
jgi:hypothetical protein